MRTLGNVMILGDSYSTFSGYIPVGYEPYYTPDTPGVTGVCKVEETWWHQVISATESNLVRNSSWSGTTICHTGYDGADCSDRSFLARFLRLEEDGFFKEHQIDTLFLFGGTNDSWADSPVGKLQYSDWSRDDLYSVLPAFCCLLSQFERVIPDTRVYCVLNTELKPVISQKFLEACRHYEIDVVNLPPADLAGGHPTVKGMREIAGNILHAIGN